MKPNRESREEDSLRASRPTLKFTTPPMTEPMRLLPLKFLSTPDDHIDKIWQ